MELPSIVLIGSGNMARFLGHAFHNSGISIKEVYSRNAETGRALADALKCNFCNSFTSITDEGDLYFFCIKDDSIAELANSFPFREKTMVHCSGSLPIDVLPSASRAVIYPAQSITSEGLTGTVPVCIEASTEMLLKTIEQLALRISKQVFEVNSEKRRQLHLAAVFANNFNNACLSIAEQLMRDADLPFSLLHPMIAATASKAIQHSPIHVQTGPAKRNDRNVMLTHLELLKDKPEIAEIYELLSAYIRRHFSSQ